MKSRCGHDHGNDHLQAVTCHNTHELSELGGGVAAATLVLRHGKPAVSVIGNHTSLAHIALEICELAMSKPRPTDCEGCAAAYDAMVHAAFILREAPRKC